MRTMRRALTSMVLRPMCGNVCVTSKLSKAVWWGRIFKEVPQGGNVPLAVPQVVEPVRLRLQRRDLEARIKIPIRHEHVQRGVQHHERNPHRVHDAFGIEQGHTVISSIEGGMESTSNIVIC